MYPFDAWWRWHLANRYGHLVEAIEDHLDRFQDPYRQVLIDRAKRMRVASRVRGFFMVLLNLSIAASLLTAAVVVLPFLAELKALVTTLAQSLAAISLLLTGIVLLITRYLGQLEADVVSSMALGSPGNPPPSPDEDSRVRSLEQGQGPNLGTWTNWARLGRP